MCGVGVKELSPTRLGGRIRKLRLGEALTQEQLAGDRYTAAYVSHIERGKRRASQEALAYFAGRLGVSLEQLVTGRDPQDELRLEVEVQRAIALMHDGDAGEARRRLQTLRRDASDLPLPSLVARAEEAIGLSLLREGLLDEALATFEGLLSTLTEPSDEEKTAAVVGVGRCLFHKGHLRDAVDLLETHLARLDRSTAPDPSSLIQVLAALIGPYFDVGQIEKAKAVSVRGAELALDVADPEALACLYINRAGLLLEEKQPREALMMLARAADMYAQLGWRAEAAKVSVARGMVLIDKGEVEKARLQFEEVLGDGSLNVRDRARALTGLARVHRLLSQPSIGLDLTKKAIALTADLPTERAEAQREAGFCARATNEVRGALRFWKTALALYQEAGDKQESATTAAAMGDLLMELGEVKQAAAVYRKGLSALGGIQ